MRVKFVKCVASSAGSVDYILGLDEDKEVRLLDAVGVDCFVPFPHVEEAKNEEDEEDEKLKAQKKAQKKAQTIAFARNVRLSMDLQTCLNPKVKNPIAHWVLSWEKNDGINDADMLKVIKRWLKDMGFENTQYLIVRHDETGTPHAHVLINLVDNNGNRIETKAMLKRSASLVAQWNHEYGFVRGDHICISNAKEDRNPRERARRACCQAVFQALCEADDKNNLEDILAKVYTHSLSSNSEFICTAQLADDVDKTTGVTKRIIIYNARSREEEGKETRYYQYKDRWLDDQFSLASIVEILNNRTHLDHILDAAERMEKKYKREKENLFGKDADEAAKQYTELLYSLCDFNEDLWRIKNWHNFSEKQMNIYLTMLHYDNLQICTENLREILSRKAAKREQREKRFNRDTPKTVNNYGKKLK